MVLNPNFIIMIMCLCNCCIDRQEIVHEMSSMVQELLIMFYKSTGGFKPHRIIMYRDGISEGQFIHVLQHELTAVREACIKVAYIFFKDSRLRRFGYFHIKYFTNV